MYWWIWALVYVAIAMHTFRFMFLRLKDQTQRWWEEQKKKDYHDRPRRSELEKMEGDDRIVSIAASVFWPLALVFAILKILFRLGRFIMFPRGIKTKFDREQELERRKVKEEAEYVKALKVLDWNQNE